MSGRPIICECECGGRHCVSNRVSVLATSNLPPTTQDKIAASNAVTREREKTVQIETAPGATERYVKWSREEIELLKDRSLTNEELAHRLGRTYFGVQSKRKRIDIAEAVRDDG